MNRYKRFLMALLLLTSPLITFADYQAMSLKDPQVLHKQDTRIKETSNGYIFSYLPFSLMKDFFVMKEKKIIVTVIHPEFGAQRISGYAYPYGLDAIKVMTKQRLKRLPDLVNVVVLMDSKNAREKRNVYRHVDTQMYWTFMPSWENPDDLTGIPTGPQPFYCGKVLCACVLGASGEAGCKGIGLSAKGGCTASTDDILVCCQTAGTSPVDSDDGQTTTCQ